MENRFKIVGELRRDARRGLRALAGIAALCGALLSVLNTTYTAMAQDRDQTHAQEQATGEDGERAWRFWGGNISNTHGSATETHISPKTVRKLQTKWIFETAGDVSATPTVEGNAVYATDWGGGLYRINAETGKAKWAHKLSDYTGNAASKSRNAPAIGPEELVLGDLAAGTVLAVDKLDGRLLWQTTVDNNVGAELTGSPVIVGERVYVGVSSNQESLATHAGFQLTFRGSVVALDLRSGHVLWQTYMVPEGYTGGAVWGSNLVVDRRRGSLFVASGNNYSVPDAVTNCLAQATTAAMKLACLDPKDYLDALLSLDLETGKVKWAKPLEGPDTWTVSCIVNPSAGIPCPDQAGPDFDFGSGPNLFRTKVHGRETEVIGAGQKSGVYWALNPDTGAVLWGTQVGPGGSLGGIEWGSAVDGKRVYTTVNDSNRESYTLQPSGVSRAAGSWAALDAGTGKIVWQVPVSGMNPLNPSQAAGSVGQVTVANGVMFAGSLSGDMVALDAATGETLWRFASGGSVICGPSVVDGSIYWGSGYSNLGIGTGNNKLYAFTLPENREHDKGKN